MWDVTPREQIVLQKIVLDPKDYSFPDTPENKLAIHLYFLPNKLEVYINLIQSTTWVKTVPNMLKSP
jgi:hypothetical protein